MKYFVNVPQIWYQLYAVEADSKEEAFNKVEQEISEGNMGSVEDCWIIDGSFEWSHDLERENWTIEEKDD